MSNHASWLSTLFDPKKLDMVSSYLADRINEDKKKLCLRGIAIRGHSGSLMAGIVSIKTGLPIILVRKPNDGTHSSYTVEMSDDMIESAKYCIIDELISSGKTITIMMNEIHNRHHRMVCKKIYIYDFIHNGRDKKEYGSDWSAFDKVPILSFMFKSGEFKTSSI